MIPTMRPSGCLMLIGLFVALLLLLFGGTPVLLGIGIAGPLGMLLSPGVVLPIFPQKMFAMLDFGLLMTIATQIGAVTPPVAVLLVLLFVATSIAGCKYNETIRYCYPFITTLVIVMLLVAFVPITATHILHRLLGP